MGFFGSAWRVRGQSHLRNGKPCQDFAVLDLTPAAAETGGDINNLAVGIVADGGGSRELSHIGSRVSALIAAALVSQVWTVSSLNAASEEKLESFWRDVFADCRTALTLEAETRNIYYPDQRPDFRPLATTLIVFMASRERVSAAQVGDGFLVVGRGVTQDSENDESIGYELMFQNARHEEASQVVWLTSSLWEDDFRTKTLSGPIDFVLASSDGMDKACLQLGQGDDEDAVVHVPYFQKVQAGLKHYRQKSVVEGGDEREGVNSYLDKLMTAEYLDEITDDDKSMAVAFWSNGNGE